MQKSGWVEKLSEYGQEIAEFAQGKNISGFTPTTFASYLQQSKQGGKIDITDKQSLVDSANSYSAAIGASAEDQKRNIEIALNSFIDPADIQKTAKDKILETNPANKKLFETKRSFDMLREKARNYFQFDEAGNLTITNPVGIADLEEI